MSVQQWMRRVWAATTTQNAPLRLIDKSPVDLRIVGRMLWHAALVGAGAGLLGALFFAGAESVQHFFLEKLTGYVQLRASGETFLADAAGPATPFRPWLLLFLPALGALIGGLISVYAPETRGGGGDAMIETYHLRGASMRPRVIWVKAAASIFTLGCGGSGGREGPTMQIGAAIGAAVARALKMSPRDRRILYLAGVAAGMAAVFRTPLGAALLAVEIIYRDDFEAEALVPAVLASVVSYSVVISIFGESTLFGHLQRFAFVPAHLPLYALMALLVAGLAAGFVECLRGAQRLFARLPGPVWLRPAAGGLALGILCTPIICVFDRHLGVSGQGLGLLGGGYGIVQMIISGTPWLPDTWTSVQLLCLLALVKMLGSACTIGSGGSAGDFAPSLVLGGIAGGIFGRVASLVLHDPRIDPGAFALVGMAAFYGGIAHVPLSSLVLVCELAGSYDLLVPLMLAEGVAFVALRTRSLYHAQIPSQRDSPAHRDSFLLDVLQTLRVRDIFATRAFASFSEHSTAVEMLDRLGSDEHWQSVYPVLDATGGLVGVITPQTLSLLASEKSNLPHTIAADLMRQAVTVGLEDDLRVATGVLVDNGVHAAVVLNSLGVVLGVVEEVEIARVYLASAVRAEAAQLHSLDSAGLPRLP